MNDFQRVSRTRRCPICDRPDWCLIAGPEADPTAAICARVESGKRCGESGWLHRLRDAGDWSRPRRQVITVATTPPAPVDFGRLADECHAAAVFDDVNQLAYDLGVTTDSLERLAVGWSRQHQAWTFPMQSAAGNVVGIRLRLSDGRKLSVRGGREGLFVPEGLTFEKPLFISEGPTDTAAILDLGFDAIGRPSCTGGTRHIIDFADLHQLDDVVVVADADDAGRRGAEKLASVLVAYVPEVRVLEMPGGTKDVRAWKQSGATHEELAAAIATARRWSVRVRVQRGGCAHV